MAEYTPELEELTELPQFDTDAESEYVDDDEEVESAPEEMDEEDEEGINLEDLHNALLLNLAEVEKRIWEREGKLN